jgi:hypothetical protein
MRERLRRCEVELRPLVPGERSSAIAREHARSFNADVAAVRAALLEPAIGLLERGAPVRDLAACLERSVAELAFWRRVLLRLHGDALGPEPARPDFLLRYLTG